MKTVFNIVLVLCAAATDLHLLQQHYGSYQF